MVLRAFRGGRMDGLAPFRGGSFYNPAGRLMGTGMAPAPVLRAVPFSFQNGGKVRRSGLAMLHKGERVVPVSGLDGMEKALLDKGKAMGAKLRGAGSRVARSLPPVLDASAVLQAGQALRNAGKRISNPAAR